MAELLKIIERKENNVSTECLKEATCAQSSIAKNLVSATLPKVEITRVTAVNNNFLGVMYELKKEEYQSRYGRVTEQLMLHATSASNVDSIIKHNLDWRRVSRNKFGSGVSFSPNADYANYHSNQNND